MAVRSAGAQALIDPSLTPGSQPGTITGRTFLIFPSYDVVFDPNAKVSKLDPRQKFNLFLRKTFDPSVPLVAAAIAGISQAAKSQPDYGQGGRAYASRFGAAAANIASANFFSTALLPTVFHQDPRFYRKGAGSIRSRFWYAISRELITRQDNGNPSFNISEVLGIGMQTALSDAYYPQNDQTFSNTFSRFGISFGARAILNVLKEFTPPRSPRPANLGQPRDNNSKP